MGYASILKSMLGRALIALAFLAIMIQSLYAQTDLRFVPGSEDIPMMETMRPLENGVMYFDSAAGRVVESQLVSDQLPSAIFSFYETTLPALGWNMTDKNHYRRAGEQLIIDVIDDQQDPLFTLLRFRLIPQ
ncbi:MAG: hypothetical protein AB8B77_00275 [Alphaproteobacteria bacterium]